MNRTQIYLSDDEVALLDAEATRTGATRSELIRRAIRARYGQIDPDARLDALNASFGSWRNRTFTGAEYVDAIRGDLNERLKRLGLE